MAKWSSLTPRGHRGHIVARFKSVEPLDWLNWLNIQRGWRYQKMIIWPLLLALINWWVPPRSRSSSWHSIWSQSPRLLLICETGLPRQVLKSIIEHLILTGFGTEWKSEREYNGWLRWAHQIEISITTFEGWFHKGMIKFTSSNKNRKRLRKHWFDPGSRVRAFFCLAWPQRNPEIGMNLKHLSASFYQLTLCKASYGEAKKQHGAFLVVLGWVWG